MTTLTDKFSPHFDAATQARGDALFAGEAVAFSESSPAHVVAEVTDGAELYEAELRVEGRELRAACPCPAGQAGGCAHLWAALRAATTFGDLGLALKSGVKLKWAAGVHAAADSARVGGNKRAVVQPEPDGLRYEAEPESVSRRRQPLSWPEPPRRAAVAESAMAPRPPPVADVERGATLFYVMTLSECGESGVAIDTFWQRKPGAPLQPYCFEPFQLRPDWADGARLDLLQPAWLGRAAGGERFLLPQRLARFVLPQLATSQRFFWRRGRGSAEELQAVGMGETAEWEFQIQVAELEGNRYAVSGLVVRSSQRLPLEQVAWCGECGLLIPWDKLEPLRDHGALKWMRQFQKSDRWLMSRFELDRLVQALLSETTVSLAALPAAVRYSEASPVVHGQLFVRTAAYKFRNREQLHADLSFRYGDVTITEDDPREIVLLPSFRHCCRRDHGAEEALRNVLRSLEFRFAASAAKEEPGWKLLPEKLDEAVRHLVDQEWLVMAEGKTYRKPREMQAQLSGSGEGRDWFELKGSVTFDGEVVPLPKLLAAYKGGSGHVLLDDGSRGVLPIEWLLKFTVLTEIGEIEGDAVKLRRSQAALISGLLEQLEIPVDETFRELRSELATFAGFAAADPPPGFCGELRPYQRQGLGWLQMLARLGLGGCLADDMGLGKTVQVLAMLESRRELKRVGPSLIVLPKSLIFNWIQEAHKFTPQLRVVEYTGGGRHHARRLFPATDLVLTTYGTLRQDAEPLSKERFDYCILDESQAIKNADSLTAKAVKLIRAEHRLAMSGTPVENHVRELFSQFDFLNPSLFGASSIQTKRANAEALDDQALASLARALKPYILRRTKAEVAKDLPAKTEQVLYCELDETQRQHYEELRAFYRDKLQREKEAQKKVPGAAPPASGGGKIDVLAALLRLRQCACHPGLVNERFLADPSAKLELLLEKIVELVEEKHKVLIFSQFTSFLKMVGQRLVANAIQYAYLDGKTIDRNAEVQRFQTDPTCEAFLISLKAGGVGLNLTAADYVFLLDPWWNPAVESQAIDRAYRIGQQRNVFAYRLIARGTVEEKVLAMQEDKRRLAADMVSQTGDFLQKLTVADLAALLD